MLTPLNSAIASCRYAAVLAATVIVRPLGAALELATYSSAMSPVPLVNVSEGPRVHGPLTLSETWT